MLHSFFGLLCCGEFVTKPFNLWSNSTSLLQYVAVDDRNFPSFIQLTVQQSKTDHFRHGSFIYLGKTNCKVCPVEAVLQYLSVIGAAPGPLFLSNNSKPLTQVTFSSAVSGLLEELGLHVANYNTHSFQISAATSAKDAGISDVYIKKLGRWQSDIFQKIYQTTSIKVGFLFKEVSYISDTLLIVCAL